MKNCHQLIVFYLLLNLYMGSTNDLLELDCNVNSDCNHVKGPDYNTTCLDGRCLCTNINGERISCKPTDNKLNNFIGGPCPCTQSHAECNRQESVCYCEKDFVPSFDRRRCIKKHCVLGDDCEDDSQCLGMDKFAECHLEQKKCVCQKNFVDHSGICISVVGVTSKCIDDKQCFNHTANSMCYQNTCTCIRGYTVSVGLKCLPFAGYKEPCKDDKQCKHKLGVGSECYMGLCSCDYKHFALRLSGEERHICERRIVRGDYCRDHNDCYQFHLQSSEQSMECFFSQCACRKGFHDVDGDCKKSGATRKELSLQPVYTLLVFMLMSPFLSY